MRTTDVWSPTKNSNRPDLRYAWGSKTSACCSKRPTSSPLRCRSPASSAIIYSRPWHTDKPISTDRKSTRLNSSHLGISYAVFGLKKEKDRAGGSRDFWGLWLGLGSGGWPAGL